MFKTLFQVQCLSYKILMDEFLYIIVFIHVLSSVCPFFNPLDSITKFLSFFHRLYVGKIPFFIMFSFYFHFMDVFIYFFKQNGMFSLYFNTMISNIIPLRPSSSIGPYLFPSLLSDMNEYSWTKFGLLSFDQLSIDFIALLTLGFCLF